MLLNSGSEITSERLEERINIRKSIRNILKEPK
jgi:hypothetical protein